MAAVSAVSTAVVALTTELVKGTSEVAQYGDNVDKMSQKMGLSAQAYQEWDFIMQHSGTSIESLQASMKTLANAVDSGNDAFQRLGISQSEIAQMNQEELFAKTIEQLQKVEDTTERTYLAGQLLGRGATELGALLNTSAEDTEAMRKQVHELGGVMSDEAVKAAAAYQDSLQNMQTAFSGLKRGMLSQFLPSIVSVMDGLALIFSGDDSGISKITQGVNDFANKLFVIIPQVVELGTEIVLNISKAIFDNLPILIETAVNLVKTLAITLIENAPMLLQSALDLLSTLNDALIDNLPMLIDSVVSLATQLATWLGENAGTFAKSAVDLIVGLAESLVSNLPELIPAIVSIITQLVTTLTEPDNLVLLLDAALAIIWAIAEGLIQSLPNLVTALTDIIDNIVEFFTDEEQRKKVGDTALELGKRLAEGIWEGVKAMGRWMRDKLFGWFDELIGDVKEDQEIHSPSRLWARVIGKPVGQGVGVGAVEGLEESEKMIQDKLDSMVADVESRTVEITPKIETATASGAVAGVDFNALASTSIDGIASIAKSVDYNALVNASLEGIGVLVDLFTSGEAKVGVDNTRDLRRALNA